MVIGWMWQRASPDLVEQLPAELPSQQAVQGLLVPAKGHPAKVLLEAELRALQAGLRQRGNQEAALTEVVRTWMKTGKFSSAFGLSNVWQAGFVPVWRSSGAEGSLVSRLWQRSPSRPVSEDAFSRPSSSTTTQPALPPEAAGTRKPEKETHQPPQSDSFTIFRSYFSKNGHVKKTTGC